MNTRPKKLLRLMVVPLLGAIPLLSAFNLATPFSARGAGTRAAVVQTGPMTIVSSVPGLALTSSVANTDGTYTVTWETSDGPGAEVQATAPAGTTVTFSLTTSTSDGPVAEVALTPPPIDKTSKSFQATVKQLYTIQAARRAAGTRSPATAVSPMSTQILASPCTDLWMDKVSGKYQAHEHFCDIEYLAVNNGGGDWYLVDKMTGTSSETATGHYNIYSTYGGDSYPSGNTMVQWAPNGSFHPSACKQYTASLTYGGLSVTMPAVFCPDSMDVYTSTLGGEGIEEFWHGCIGVGSVGFNPLDTIHNPPAASDYATVHAYMHLMSSC